MSEPLVDRSDREYWERRASRHALRSRTRRWRSHAEAKDLSGTIEHPFGHRTRTAINHGGHRQLSLAL